MGFLDDLLSGGQKERYYPGMQPPAPKPQAPPQQQFGFPQGQMMPPAQPQFQAQQPPQGMQPGEKLPAWAAAKESLIQANKAYILSIFLIVAGIFVFGAPFLPIIGAGAIGLFFLAFGIYNFYRIKRYMVYLRQTYGV